MAKKKRPAGAARKAAPPVVVATPEPRMRPWVPYALSLLVLVAIAAGWFITQRTAAPVTDGAPANPAPSAAAVPAAKFVGSPACAGCHADAYAKWQGSQHAAAMLPADSRSVHGDFSGAKFTYGGVTSVFSTRDGRYFVRTDGPGGKIGEFEVKYAFGVEPLQQYLIELPGGRLQALGVAWDARPKEAGGQRWFHLYPDRRLKAGDALHWTGIDQNWNYQCADCHSTDLRKNYDAQSNTFRTAWSEVNVGCESCHGPASNHAAWANKDAGAAGYANHGLTAALDERRGVTWTPDGAAGNAARSKPRESDREIEVCARCHSRRGQFSDAHVAGQPFHDAFRPALLEQGLYHPDGQQLDEVYTYASFLQSRMHAKGVTCSDCHDPHSMKLRAPGNATCAGCHAPARFDTPEHHHHRAGSPAAQCTACHMPTTTYMGVDPRHDHSMRIPRPDRTVSMGTPNACGGCHREASAQWAADAVKKWNPQGKGGFQSFAEAFDLADRGAPGAQRALLEVIRDRGQSGMARASALVRLPRYLSPATLPAAIEALNDPDVNVRMAAVRVVGSADPATRLQYLPRMLGDPSRVVRMDAARALAGESERRLSPADRARFDTALAEYVDAQKFNADRPEGQTALATLYLSRGEFEDATAAYRAALRLDPRFVEAAVNLSDLYRVRGLESEAERVLRDTRAVNPRSAQLAHALGLTLIRQKRIPEAMIQLAEAAKLAPEDPRFAYVYAVALHDTGKPADAMRVLSDALKRHPYDRDLLMALATYEQEAGRIDAARSRVRLLRELEPDDPRWTRTSASTEGMSRAPR